MTTTDRILAGLLAWFVVAAGVGVVVGRCLRQMHEDDDE
jgi:hypothetical protein